jgi:hypothetical protein
LFLQFQQKGKKVSEAQKQFVGLGFKSRESIGCLLNAATEEKNQKTLFYFIRI